MKRYDFNEHGHYDDERYHSMDESDQGEYVKYADIEHLLARPEEPVISAGGMQELKLYGTPGYVGTVGPAFTVHVDPDVPAHTIIVRDGYGRELGRIINIGGSSAPQTRKE